MLKKKIKLFLVWQQNEQAFVRGNEHYLARTDKQKGMFQSRDSKRILRLATVTHDPPIWDPRLFMAMPLLHLEAVDS